MYSKETDENLVYLILEELRDEKLGTMALFPMEALYSKFAEMVRLVRKEERNDIEEELKNLYFSLSNWMAMQDKCNECDEAATYYLSDKDGSGWSMYCDECHPPEAEELGEAWVIRKTLDLFKHRKQNLIVQKLTEFPSLLEVYARQGSQKEKFLEELKKFAMEEE